VGFVCGWKVAEAEVNGRPAAVQAAGRGVRVRGG
jgi:hypothetical protein